MKTFYVSIAVPDTTPDPEVGDYGRLAPDAIALLAAQPDAYRQIITEEEIQTIANGIASRKYRDTVQAIADDLHRAIADGEINDREDADTWLEQTIDGHHDVIYTYAAMEVCRQSSNDSAYFDDFGSDGAVSDSGIEWSKLAYYALLADVREAIDLDAWLTCADCAGAVDAGDLQIAGVEELPRCADCRAADDETDGDDTTGGAR